MSTFLYGRTYVVERTATSITAFEIMSRGEDFIHAYIRKYTPESNDIESLSVSLHVSRDEGEWILYKNPVHASDAGYEGELYIFTKEGLKEYDAQLEMAED
ncbi:hypothetical protein [Jeotgalibaca porci]|uniref:hypothetical protein n=1 Tax=Jeotgalibaca porci TaxID=1868793 RepID=UPI00359F1DDA